VEADLTRTAFSPLIYEYKDYAVGLIDAKGRSIALARQGGPGFVVNLIGLAHVRRWLVTGIRSSRET